MSQGLPSAEEYMRKLGVRRLTKMFPKYVDRWVPVKEALPPERLGVLVARNDLDAPEFAYLRYSAGCKDSPFFVCSGFAALELRGVKPFDGLVAVTHWYSPSIEGLPVVTAGLFSDKGLGDKDGVIGTRWFDTSDYTLEGEQRKKDGEA